MWNMVGHGCSNSNYLQHIKVPVHAHLYTTYQVIHYLEYVIVESQQSRGLANLLVVC